MTPDPYIRSVASRPCWCPKCGHRAVWEPTLSPHAAYRTCPACGWSDTVLSPEGESRARAAGGKILEMRPRGR